MYITNFANLVLTFFEKQNRSLPPLEEREGGPNPLKYADPSGELYYLKQATSGTPDYRAPRDYSNYIRKGNYGDIIGGGGGSYVGAPGYRDNGTGENGVYFDWYSGTYRSTDTGNYALTWENAYNIASHDAIELVYRGRATNMGDGSYASNPLGNVAVYVWTPITNVYGNLSGQGDGLLSPVDTKYPITSPYTEGNRVIPELGINRPHLAIDIGTPVGTPIQSPWSGKVVMAQDTKYGLSVIVNMIINIMDNILNLAMPIYLK
ncbi:MAG: hypothetical protein RBS73_12330 [Prolixibacteraceae bacterium]|jgi:murein DD-endopeptidase MepM/ murein hydrolase activator NlpD|nr:hypothetical protein [Prolixibacteraceae bacterium]